MEQTPKGQHLWKPALQNIERFHVDTRQECYKIMQLQNFPSPLARVPANKKHRQRNLLGAKELRHRQLLLQKESREVPKTQNLNLQKREIKQLSTSLEANQSCGSGRSPDSTTTTRSKMPEQRIQIFLERKNPKHHSFVNILLNINF